MSFSFLFHWYLNIPKLAICLCLKRSRIRSTIAFVINLRFTECFDSQNKIVTVAQALLLNCSVIFREFKNDYVLDVFFKLGGYEKLSLSIIDGPRLGDYLATIVSNYSYF